jgi:hypothetical protein
MQTKRKTTETNAAKAEPRLPDTLSRQNLSAFEKYRGVRMQADGRLLFVKAKAEEIDSKKLMALVDEGAPQIQTKK